MLWRREAQHKIQKIGTMGEGGEGRGGGRKGKENSDAPEAYMNSEAMTRAYLSINSKAGPGQTRMKTNMEAKVLFVLELI